MVHQVAWRILGSESDAEDVVQEVFMEAFHRYKIAQANNIAGLLRRMATYRALDVLRTRKKSATLDAASNVSVRNGPVQTAIQRELSDRLRQALLILPKRQAAVFCLRFFEDASYEAISSALGIKVGAVGVALHKARSRLSELLKDESDIPRQRPGTVNVPNGSKSH